MRFSLRRILSLSPLRPLLRMEPPDRNVFLICLGAAFVFWLILNLSQEYEIEKTVHLEYVVDPERVLVGTMPQTIPVELRGQGWNLIWESLRSSELPVEVDLRNRDNLLLTRSELQLDVQRELSSGDLSITNLGFDGATILTTPMEGKRVAVVSQVRARYANGYQRSGAVRIAPDSVTVAGSADALEEVDEWQTMMVQLEGVRRDVRLTVPLAAPPEGLTISYEEVEVAFDVQPYIEERITVPVTVINPPPADSFRVFPETVELEVAVSQDYYGTLRPDDFRLVADLENVPPDARNSVPLTMVGRPQGVVSIHYRPRSVEFYVFRRSGGGTSAVPE